jgi:predicted nucleic-acid-binding Zn-ribbon protein
MKRRYLVDSIVQEYKMKKKFEAKMEMQNFIKKNCINCKNKELNKCKISRNTHNELMCAFFEEI